MKKNLQNHVYYEMEDMDVLDFARSICMLTLDTPLTNGFAQKFGQKNRWYSSEREHLTAWSLFQPTLGVPGFMRSIPNSSSKRMYHHLMRPESLLWLAEACGIDSKEIEDLIDKITKSEQRPATMCKVIREAIPFYRIFNSLTQASSY